MIRNHRLWALLLLCAVSLGWAQNPFKKKFEFYYVEDATIQFAYECLEDPACTTQDKIQARAVLTVVTSILSSEIQHVTTQCWKRPENLQKEFFELKHPNFWPEDVRQNPTFFGLYNRSLACAYLDLSKGDATCTKENCGKKIYKRILKLEERAVNAYAKALEGGEAFFECETLPIEWFYHLIETNAEFRQQIEQQIMEQLEQFFQEKEAPNPASPRKDNGSDTNT